MNSGNRISYHPQVFKYDLPKLGMTARTRIRKAIEHKLAVAPQLYVIPLRGTLAQLWKLRIGDYGVVFCLDETDVMILAMGHRSVVYEVARRRASIIP